METSRNDTTTEGADSTENCNTAGRGGRPREREREKAPAMAGGSGGGRRPGRRRAMEEDQPPTRKVKRGGTRWRKTPVDVQPKDRENPERRREKSDIGEGVH